MGKNKREIAECTPRSNNYEGSLGEQNKKKKFCAEVSVDDFCGSPVSKLITKEAVHVLSDKQMEVERSVLERKLKKERKKERRKTRQECSTDIKMEPEFLVEEMTSEERRISENIKKKGLKIEERKLKKEHLTGMKKAEKEFSMDQELAAEERRVAERKLKKERKKGERKSKKECPAENKEANSDLSLEERLVFERKLKKERKKEKKKSENECPAENKEAKSELSLEEKLTAEERRVFERKLKKERKKEQRKLEQACVTNISEVTTQKPSGCELALQYLTSWSQKAKAWKFQKTRQTWLLMHLYDSQKVPASHFSILLDYLEGLQGSARDLTARKAEALMKEHENANTEDESLLEPMERARQVIQLLS